MEEGWECVECCPIRLLDEQSKAAGVHSSGAAHSKTFKSNQDAMYSGYSGERKLYRYGENGNGSNASRYFQTFPPQEEDNLIEPVEQAEVSARSSARIIQGDCVEEMRSMPESSVDSVVCDPPYFLSFMNRKWDSAPTPQEQQRQHEAWAREALRVLKPGGYLLAFGGTRTVHRLACAIEDAGFEIRDRHLNLRGGDAVESIPGEIAWIYGSGFPKSHNIEKAIAKMQGQKRRAHGMVPLAGPQSAQIHAGIGSACKPSYEPIVCARKPLSEANLAKNILAHGEWLEDGTVYKVGTGGLNIDASRVGHSDDLSRYDHSKTSAMGYQGVNEPTLTPSHPSGRFPSNTLWSHVPPEWEKVEHAPECEVLSPVASNCVAWCPIVLAGEEACGDEWGNYWIQVGGCKRVGSRRVKKEGGPPSQRHAKGGFSQGGGNGTTWEDYADPDGLEEVAAYECVESCAVRALDEQSGVSKKHHEVRTDYDDIRGGNFINDRTKAPIEGEPRVRNYAGEGGASRYFSQFHDPGFRYCPKSSKRDRTANGTVENGHPTCKPTELMRYLLRLVTPPGGTTLDPFAGSGTTGVAALSEGFNAILIEAEPEYVEIAEARCAHALSERVEPKKGEVKTAKEWGLKNVHPQDTPLRYDPDECPEEGGTYSPAELEEFSGRLPF